MTMDDRDPQRNYVPVDTTGYRRVPPMRPGYVPGGGYQRSAENIAFAGGDSLGEDPDDDFADDSMGGEDFFDDEEEGLGDREYARIVQFCIGNQEVTIDVVNGRKDVQQKDGWVTNPKSTLKVLATTTEKPKERKFSVAGVDGHVDGKGLLKLEVSTAWQMMNRERGREGGFKRRKRGL